jgi:hypothetical protein
VTLEAPAIRPGPVTFVVRNAGTLVHGFEIESESEGSHRGPGGGDRFEVEAPRFGPGDTVRVNANLPIGLYEIECYVANHEALGMRALLEVRADAPMVEPKPSAAGGVRIQGSRSGRTPSRSRRGRGWSGRTLTRRSTR